MEELSDCDDQCELSLVSFTDEKDHALLQERKPDVARQSDGAREPVDKVSTRPRGLVVAESTEPPDLDSDLQSVSQVDCLDPPCLADVSLERPAINTDKGWDLQVDVKGDEVGRHPPGFPRDLLKKRQHGGVVEITEVSVFGKPVIPGPQHLAWDLETDPPESERSGRLAPGCTVHGTQVISFGEAA
mmetsp:Transcript_38096/g.75560  ORF Transcript_38096/g.75560 Transcript_38096/m.75560 type:complete len:187 (+) Transcript_38096:57-617(+)